MTRIIRLFTSVICVAWAVVAGAQPMFHNRVNIGLVYPLSSNGTQAPACSNLISINAIAGISAEEYSLTLAGVCNIVRYNASGLTAAGVVNTVGGNANAIQLAGVSNLTAGNVNGLQAAGILNICRNINGVQLSGFANTCRGTVQGAQFAGFVNRAAQGHGQFAGFINLANNIEGMQVAGFCNINNNRVRGMQVAGFSNQAKQANVQVAGFVNTADSVEGVQIAGFINVARKVKGVQISGFINIADSSDYPIGLLNLVKQGEKAIGVSLDERGTTMATFRSGGKVLYGLLGAGVNNYKSNGLYAVGAGLGAHLRVNKYFRVNIEAGMNTLADMSGRYYFNTGVKIFPSIKVARVEIYGGPTLNYDSYSRRLELLTTRNNLWTGSYYNHMQDVHIGFTGGLQLHI